MVQVEDGSEDYSAAASDSKCESADTGDDDRDLRASSAVSAASTRAAVLASGSASRSGTPVAQGEAQMNTQPLLPSLPITRSTPTASSTPARRVPGTTLGAAQHQLTAVWSERILRRRASGEVGMALECGLCAGFQVPPHRSLLVLQTQPAAPCCSVRQA